MLRLLLIFLIPSVPVQAVELLRDRHGSQEYVFEADQTEMMQPGQRYALPTGLCIFTKTFSTLKTVSFETNQFDFG